jgi:hypothetical protein
MIAGQAELRSAGEYRSLLCTRFGFGCRLGRQLQNGGLLALAQEREKEHLSVRQFERIVMHMRLLSIDLTEDRGLMRRGAGGAIETNLGIKGEFRTR